MGSTAKKALHIRSPLTNSRRIEKPAPAGYHSVRPNAGFSLSVPIMQSDCCKTGRSVYRGDG